MYMHIYTHMCIINFKKRQTTRSSIICCQVCFKNCGCFNLYLNNEIVPVKEKRERISSMKTKFHH